MIKNVKEYERSSIREYVYQGIFAPGLFGLTGTRDGRLVDAKSAACRSL